ncbi:MAG: hypothetical protein Hens3KO_12580 [Henriciella sp.]
MKMIAVRNIEHDWKRSLSTVVVLSLVGLLIFQQFGSILGRWNSLGAFERELRADLVVKARIAPGRVSRPILGSLPPGVENKLLIHPEVEVIRAYKGFPETIRLEGGIPTAPPAFISIDPGGNPILYPLSFPDDLLPLLQVEGHVIANTEFAQQFGLTVGDTLSHNDFELTFVAFVDALSDFRPIMIASNLTAGAIGEAQSQSSAPSARRTITVDGTTVAVGGNSAFLLKLNPAADPEIVAGELRGMFANPAIEVVFPEQLVSEQSFALLFSDRDNRSFLITAVFAILISILIAIQTMRGAVLNHADEFGALQALGVGSLDLRLIAIETAFWLGLLSTAVAVSGAFVMQTVLRASGAQFALSFQLIFVVGALLMAIALLAGIFASSAVTRIRPEALLR